MPQYLINNETGDTWPIEEFFGKGRYSIRNEEMPSSVSDFVGRYLVRSENATIHTDELYAYFTHLNDNHMMSRVAFAGHLRLAFTSFPVVKTTPSIGGKRAQGFRGVAVSYTLTDMLIRKIEAEKERLMADFIDAYQVLREMMNTNGSVPLAEIVEGMLSGKIKHRNRTPRTDVKTFIACHTTPSYGAETDILEIERAYNRCQPFLYRSDDASMRRMFKRELTARGYGIGQRNTVTGVTLC
jgi:hypothetical protein